MLHSALINATILNRVLRDIPRPALEMYLLLMMRLSRLNHLYKIWHTDVVIYPDREFPIPAADIPPARQYLLDCGLVRAYRDGFYEMQAPTNCGIMKYPRKLTATDTKVRQSLRNYPVASQLRSWRLSRGLTKTAAAKILNISPDTYTPIENGHRNPRPATLLKLRPALDHDSHPA